MLKQRGSIQNELAARGLLDAGQLAQDLQVPISGRELDIQHPRDLPPAERFPTKKRGHQPKLTPKPLSTPGLSPETHDP
jgi:hypothetical protein